VVVTRSLTHGFLFADLRGYTAYLDRRGAVAAAALLDRFRILVRSAVALHSGAEIRTEGDSFYIVFPSASTAVACALEIARAAADSAIHAEPIQVGIGVHAGEALETPEGPVGTAVNIAARLCAIAGPGEVIVSDTVRALTRSVGDARFVAVGRRPLKGLDEPLSLYRAVPSDAIVVSRRAPSPAVRAAMGLGVIGIVVIGIAAVSSLMSPSVGPSTGAAEGSSDEFASRNFAVPFTIDLGPEWTLVGDRADVVALVHESQPRGWIDIVLVSAVLEPPCAEASPEFIGAAPEDVIDWLAGRPWLVHDSPRPYNVGAYTGRSVDIELPMGEPTPCAEDPGSRAFFRLGSPEERDPFGSLWTLEVGERKRVISIDVGGRTVTLVIGSPFDDVEQFWQLAAPKLQTIEFTER
jgi:class 3 adenylate cyclase